MERVEVLNTTWLENDSLRGALLFQIEGKSAYVVLYLK